MKYLFHLSGEDIQLAFAELEALLGKFKLIKKSGPTIILDSKLTEKEIQIASKRSSRITYATAWLANIPNFEFSNIDKLNFNWVKPPFAIRLDDLNKQFDSGIEARIAAMLWDKINNPSVNLEKPKTTVFFIAETNKIHLTKLLWKKEHARFKLRQPSKKPAFHPTALKPELARLIINLARAKQKDLLLDPFCGTGSTLIEAAILGCKITGTDIDSRMIKKSELNLSFYKTLYKYKKYNVKKFSALELSKKFKKNTIDAIATDPPYGRSSYVGAKNVKTLYSGFLGEAHKVLKKGKYLAMLYAHYSKIDKLINKKKWNISYKGGIYVHGGLTRTVLVLQKK